VYPLAGNHGAKEVRREILRHGRRPAQDDGRAVARLLHRFALILHFVQDDRRAVARLSIVVVIETEARDSHHTIDAGDGMHQIIELSGAADF
jgi:hypothetical protein